MVDMSDTRLDGQAVCRALKATALGQTLYILGLVANVAFASGLDAMTAGISDAVVAQDRLLRARISGVLRETHAWATKPKRADESSPYNTWDQRLRASGAIRRP